MDNRNNDQSDWEWLGEALAAIMLVGFVPVAWCVLGSLGLL